VIARSTPDRPLAFLCPPQQKKETGMPDNALAVMACSNLASAGGCCPVVILSAVTCVDERIPDLAAADHALVVKAGKLIHPGDPVSGQFKEG
jgi:hypothetical protein